MEQIKFFKVTVLPAELQPDSFYFVENNDYAESYLTDKTGTAKDVGNSTMINALIASATPPAQVNADWDATSGAAEILHKPTALSAFTNDEGFITIAAVPTEVSQLTNDAGYLTAASTIPWSSITSTPVSLAGYGIIDPIVVTSGSYSDPTWITTLAAAKIVGVLSIDNIPAAAIERIYIYAGVATTPETIGLTTNDVQNGDVVKMNSTGLMYIVSDDQHLNQAGSFVEFTAGSASSVPWTGVTSTPTSLAGYGILDPIVLTSGSYVNPTWITSLAWTKITGTPTSLSGYGIADPIVLTTGSYANPTWITSLAYSKLTGAPTIPVPGGTTNAVQYNNAGAFTGSTTFTWDGTNLNLASGQSISALRVASTSNVIGTSDFEFVQNGNLGIIQNKSAAPWINFYQNNNQSMLLTPSGNLVIGYNADLNTGRVQAVNSGLGSNTVGGISISNTTAATSSQNQIAPSLIFSGYGWKTNATAASQQVLVRQYVTPLTNTVNPVPALHFDWSPDNGTTWNNLMSITPFTYSANILNSLSLQFVPTGLTMTTGSGAGIALDGSTPVGNQMISLQNFIFINGNSGARWNSTWAMQLVGPPSTQSNNQTSNGLWLNYAFASAGFTASGLNALYVAPTINQTGSATGTTRGIYINPTLTAATDWRAIEVVVGKVILAVSTVKTASLNIPTGVAPTTPVEGDMWKTGTNLFIYLNGTTTQII